ncbi:spore germination protein GerPE [Bacillus massiliglaciei]|uniref:spore germination protein GerPE n=1 Tax=Bacillus massiliglaciei TaxID=1816693 RepID=UPI000DA610FD|nr:spore germination protein GerPE [Bacillus massiliglaciei]
MFRRLSKVKSIEVQTLSFSSLLQIGDMSYIDGVSYALADQRKESTFLGQEGHFDYPVFRRPPIFLPLDEPVSISFENPSPVIQVNSVDIIGISSSSVVGVGNAGDVRMISRIKHIREIPEENQPDEPVGEIKR